jgi:hypothetical protein
MSAMQTARQAQGQPVLLQALHNHCRQEGSTALACAKGTCYVQRRYAYFSGYNQVNHCSHTINNRFVACTVKKQFRKHWKNLGMRLPTISRIYLITWTARLRSEFDGYRCVCLLSELKLMIIHIRCIWGKQE